MNKPVAGEVLLFRAASNNTSRMGLLWTTLEATQPKVFSWIFSRLMYLMSFVPSSRQEQWKHSVILVSLQSVGPARTHYDAARKIIKINSNEQRRVERITIW